MVHSLHTNNNNSGIRMLTVEDMESVLISIAEGKIPVKTNGIETGRLYASTCLYTIICFIASVQLRCTTWEMHSTLQKVYSVLLLGDSPLKNAWFLCAIPSKSS